MSIRTARISLAAGLAGAALFASLLPAPVMATTPGQNGLIAFRRFNADQTTAALFTVNPDGTHERQVTFPADNAVDALGNWSPDGRQLIFVRTAFCGDDCGGDELFVVNVDGSGLHHIATPSGAIEAPAWSPDGTTIAFSMATGGPVAGTIDVSIWEIHPDGSGLHQITHPIGLQQSEDHAVQFSPDGGRLVIERQLATCGFCPAIFTVDATDGSHAVRVSPRGLNGFDHPDWSPDGRWVIFRTGSGRGGSAKVFVAHPDGTELQLILDGTRDGRSFRSSTFSPDGHDMTIAIIPGPGANADIWIGHFTGAERIDRLTPVTRTDAFESSVRWGTAPLLP